MRTISIIVPVYNVELYLEECIESIIAQTYKDVEIILIDDGSTDKSGAICDKIALKDERIIVVHKVNGGLSSARNLGIEIAQGKYIIFVDSDDYWIGKESLTHLYRLAEEFNADVVRGEYISVNEKGERIRTITKNKINLDKRLLDSATFYINAIAGENFSVLFLFKKEAIGELRFNEKLRIQEDIDFNIKFFSYQRNCVYTKESFYVYRKRENSITTLPQMAHLIDSFYLCDVFEIYSKISKVREIQNEYQKQSVLKYLRALSTIAEEPYYGNLKKVMKTININGIYTKTIKRLLKYRLINRKAFYIILPPYFFIKLLHLKIYLFNKINRNK